MLIEIYSNLSNYIDQRMSLLSEAGKSPLEIILAKKEILDILRVRAFRHKNCFGNFLDVIYLQEAFTLSSDTSALQLVEFFCSRNLNVCQVEGTDIYVFATEKLISDNDIATRFCLSNTIVSRILYSEVMLVANAIPAIASALSCTSSNIRVLPKDSIISQYAMQSAVEKMCLVCRSSADLQSWAFQISRIGGVDVFHEFDGFTMIKCGVTHIHFSRLVEKNVALIGQKLVQLNISLGLDEVSSVNPGDLAELFHSIYVSVNFAYEFLLETRKPCVEAQQLFTLFSSPAVDWISSCLSAIMACPSDPVPWFNISYSSESLNNLYSMDAFQKNRFNDDEIQKLKDVIQKFESFELPSGLKQQRAFVADQCRSFFLKLVNQEPEIIPCTPTARYPDQKLLEYNGYFILSSFNAREKLLYKCLNQRTRRVVMIKRIPKGKHMETATVTAELATLMSLQHNNIVRYLDGFENDSFWFMATEFCSDNDLSHLGQLPEIEALNFGRQILNGLFYLHKHHIVHRDIKPGNIFKDGRGFVKLADFGEAKLIPLTDDSEKFDLAKLSGTPSYMAPESLHMASVYPSADIWSLGCVVIFLLTGKGPWGKCHNRMNVLFTLGTTEELPYDIDSVPCSDDLKRILRSMLQRDPASRPTVSLLLAEPIFINVPESII